MRPLIGITPKKEIVKGRPHVTLPEGYVEAILRADGTPLILPVLTDRKVVLHFASSIDGLLLSGGGDIHPRFYGEDLRAPMELSPEGRTVFEQMLLHEVIKHKKPVLGICLGIQSINVALGGTLFQDIPSQIRTSINHRSRHSINIEKNSLLFRVLKAESMEVSSAHHQSVKVPGKGLRPVATAPDGVIEAIEMEEYPFLIGVQWHPERDLEDIYTERLFKAFVDAAGRGVSV